ncbi:hypothetical protein [Erwinia psidii]|nr:hypothetical protein [Erwinia psidii]
MLPFRERPLNDYRKLQLAGDIPVLVIIPALPLPLPLPLVMVIAPVWCCL